MERFKEEWFKVQGVRCKVMELEELKNSDDKQVRKIRRRVMDSVAKCRDGRALLRVAELLGVDTS